MRARTEKAFMKDTTNVKGFLAILSRFGDAEQLCDDFIKNFDTDPELKKENDFMYGAEDNLDHDDDPNDNYYDKRNGSADSDKYNPKKLILRHIKGKKIKIIKNPPTKEELYNRA